MCALISNHAEECHGSVPVCLRLEIQSWKSRTCRFFYRQCTHCWRSNLKLLIWYIVGRCTKNVLYKLNYHQRLLLKVQSIVQWLFFLLFNPRTLLKIAISYKKFEELVSTIYVTGDVWKEVTIETASGIIVHIVKSLGRNVKNFALFSCSFAGVAEYASPTSSERCWRGQSRRRWSLPSRSWDRWWGVPIKRFSLLLYLDQEYLSQSW